MSRIDKLMERLQSKPNDFTYDELKRLLGALGYEEKVQGKTSGSRVTFYRESDQSVIKLHKPHPGKIVKQYMIRDIIAILEERGDL